jgi:hypothetical protein
MMESCGTFSVAGEFVQRASRMWACHSIYISMQAADGRGLGGLHRKLFGLGVAGRLAFGNVAYLLGLEVASTYESLLISVLEGWLQISTKGPT